MEVWQSILLALGGNAVLLVVLGCLARSFGSQLLAKDLERFKAELAASQVASAERLKHDLQLATLEHQVRFSKLHARRAEVTAELYEKLMDFLGAAASFVSPFGFEGEASKVEKAAKLGDAAADFRAFFQRHRIYFTEELCEKVEKLEDSVHSPATKYRVWLRAVQDGDSTSGEYMNAWERRGRQCGIKSLHWSAPSGTSSDHS